MDKEKLENILVERIKLLFESVLDYADVAISSNDVYKKFRSKVLRVGNNCIRNVQKDLKDYNVEYDERKADDYQRPHKDKEYNITKGDNSIGKELNISEEWKNKR